MDAQDKKIFIVEDERDILELIRMQLNSAGFTAKGFETALPMLNLLKIEHPDLLILDLMLPDIDGMEVCRQLKNDKATQKIPILMLTARTDLEDKIKGLEYGADDYITKPFETRELIARIKAILRRSDWESDKNVLSITENFIIDFNRYEVWVQGKRLDLTLTEFKILQLLTKRPGWVYNRSQILDYLWGNDKIVIERTIDVHIRNLREKLGNYAYLIKNIRGVGYQFLSEIEDDIEKD
ncbi:MAG TPA: response regulator transcription factor [Candidatus Cloacimonas sp.]|jgi:two-component system phosphate regulon response regulator PhoB/two-component system alkaline phosphatase synthesis response regulator PhoP|nr:response regulator transcription factor [Candidatus Cloacimonas sp.]MDD2249933.1 response regulator transcription factor [Candidatus Cloacimonadota bacterium]MCK9158230.1 response regulator transcription factor [Candidatus Cloacimonas sp.]MCK9164353.1 response regulator transcription factor [Candidatus Cloacimonas sp.]MDD3733725.1 response regulator transcription factor [Candidatus Cloacimonadota bacterium]